MRKKKKKKYKRKKKVEGGIKGGKNKSKAKQILAELARKEHGSPVQCVGLVMFVRWQEGKVNVRWAWSKEWARVCRYLCVVLARAPRTQRVVVLECKGAGWRGGKKKKKKVLNSIFDFSGLAKWQAIRLSQSRFRSGGNVVFRIFCWRIAIFRGFPLVWLVFCEAQDEVSVQAVYFDCKNSSVLAP